MRTILLLAAVGGTAYALGARATKAAAPSRKHYSLYQRAALLWTSPEAVRTRRVVKKGTRRLRS